MEIPRTKGYTEIVKITEAALNGDIEKAKKYINKYLIKFPESDLVYPFTALLRGDLNPSGLHLCAQEETSHEHGTLPIPDTPNSFTITCMDCGTRHNGYYTICKPSK